MVIGRIFKRMNLAVSRCSELVYIELSYYFVPTAVLKKERSGLRDWWKTVVGVKECGKAILNWLFPTWIVKTNFEHLLMIRLFLCVLSCPVWWDRREIRMKTCMEWRNFRFLLTFFTWYVLLISMKVSNFASKILSPDVTSLKRGQKPIPINVGRRLVKEPGLLQIMTDILQWRIAFSYSPS